MSSSICEFNKDFPGVAFSKQRIEAIMTNKGGIIKGEGIELSVPPGAISEGDEITITIQACVGGPFCLPEDDLVFIISYSLHVYFERVSPFQLTYL